MTRRTRVEVAAIAVLAAAVVVLFLNLREVDDYPPGLDAASAAAVGDLPSWLPPHLEHPCESCDRCGHRFQLTECRLAVTVTDHDGWHRLFWAGRDTYVYDDPAFVGAALRNRTADLAGGTWTIRGRYATWHDPVPPHPCSAMVNEVDLRYRLRRGQYPGPGDPALDPSGTLAVPRRLLWFRYPFPPDREDDFWWELETPETFAGPSPMPCACGK